MNIHQDVSWKEDWGIILKSIDKLNDRTKFNYKMEYYFLTGDEDLHKKLALRQVKLYPDDIEAHSNLAAALYSENKPERFDNVIREYKLMLKLDPEKYELYKSIGSTYNQKADYDSSITYYNKYAEIFNDDSGVLFGLADVYRQLGQFNEAISTIEDAILLSNEELYLKTSLLNYSYQDKRINSIDYLLSLNTMLLNTDSFNDSVHVYFVLNDLYFDLGKVNEGIEILGIIKKMYFRRVGEFSALMRGLNSYQMKFYIIAGLSDVVKASLDRLSEIAVSPYDNRLSYLQCFYYLYTENYDLLAATIDAAESGYADF